MVLLFFNCAHTLCVQLFKGKFYYCDGLDVSNITNRTQCLQAGYRWNRRKYNFDNLGQVWHTHRHARSPDTCCDRGLDCAAVSQSCRRWCRCLCCRVRTDGSASCMTAWMLLGWTSRWGAGISSRKCKRNTGGIHPFHIINCGIWLCSECWLKWVSGCSERA